MSSLTAKKPYDLVYNDQCWIVSFSLNKLNSAEIELSVVDDVECSRHDIMYLYHIIQNRYYPLTEKEWGSDLSYTPSNKKRYFIFRLDQREKAEEFIKNEVPKLQLAYIKKELDKTRQKFTNELSIFEKLTEIVEKISEKNIQDGNNNLD